jgi:hypothetical protein
MEQVDFLTTMLSVAGTEHMEEMRKYVMDPENNPKPDIRIQNIKEYKEVVETLNKLVASTANDGRKKPSMIDALNGDKPKAIPGAKKAEELDAADIIAGVIEE